MDMEHSVVPIHTPCVPSLANEGEIWRPHLTVDASHSRKHIIAFADEQTPYAKRLPTGVFGCEIWFKMGAAAPADPSELTLLGIDTQSPYTVTYDMESETQIVHYQARWTYDDGEAGAWSKPIKSVISA